MGNLVLILILGFTSGNLWAQKSLDQCESPFQKTLTEFRDVIAAGLSSDIKEFCDRTNYEGVFNANFHYEKQFSYNEMPKLKNNLKERLPEKINAWSLSWIADEELRSKVLPRALGSLSYSEKDLKKMIQDEYTPMNSSQKEKHIQWFNGVVQSLKNEDKKNPANSKNTSMNRMMACLSLRANPSFVAKCAKQLDRAISIGGVLNGFLMLTDVYEKVLFSQDYGKGLHLAVKKIHQKYRDKNPPQGDLFSDLKDSFIESGFSEAEAKEMTWDVVGIISSSGPNLYRRIYDLQQVKNPIGIYLTAIAAMLPLLDLKSRDLDRMYSYPQNIQTHCDLGKPYHFWMSAYLTRRLNKELNEPDVNAAAVFTLQKGYQFAADVYNRNPSRALYTETFEGFNNIMRIDMTYAAAGAKFAIEADKEEPQIINVDNGIINILRASEMTPTIPANDAKDLFNNNTAKAFLIWSKKLAPNAAYDTFFAPSTQTPINLLPPALEK
ncbi:MAG: hypothetical protein KDD34_04565 [Bdellovibrionales bacterium]|nr:hypothetical protein [Bdellovibrionales bacterium]